MSRSFKHTPIRTILNKMSQHRGKKAASRKFRRIAKMDLQDGKEILPLKSIEITDTYDLGGDGKVYRPNDEHWNRK